MILGLSLMMENMTAEEIVTFSSKRTYGKIALSLPSVTNFDIEINETGVLTSDV
jgi:hypothetical protein